MNTLKGVVRYFLNEFFEILRVSLPQFSLIADLDSLLSSKSVVAKRVGVWSSLNFANVHCVEKCFK